MPKFTAEELKHKNPEELAILAERNHPLSAEGVLIQEEFKRRRDLANRHQWYSKPSGLILLGVIASFLAAMLFYFYGPHK